MLFKRMCWEVLKESWEIMEEEIKYSKLKIELLGYKYLMKTLIYGMYDLHYKLDILLDKYNLKDEELPKTPMRQDKTNDVYFDLFQISKFTYKRLIDKYGLDVVTKCCGALDDFIRDKGYCPYGTPLKAITKIIGIHSKERKSDGLNKAVDIFEPIDYNTIADVTTAKKYILSIPYWKRNITKEVIELIERFNIEDLNIRKDRSDE